MKTGVVIIGIGKNYRNMAANLAASVRLAEPELGICIITDKNEFPGVLVDKVKVVDPPRNYYRFKTHLNELTPYKRSIYLDADSIVINPELFREMVDFVIDKPLAIMSRGEGQQGAWIDLKTARNKYGLKEDRIYPHYNTSVLAWSNSKTNDRFFEAAKAVYSDPMPFNGNGHFPDEAAFGIASMKVNRYGKQGRFWEPAYYFEGTNHKAGHILENYPLLTLAGTVRNRIIENIYNGTSQKVGRALGVRTFKLNK